jgi:CheY-like chemotaxis protein
VATILVVDDEAAIRSLMRKSLEEVGHQVVEARDGAEGLQVFQEHRPDLVITDIFMPEKEGLGLIRELKKHPEQVKILAMSGGSRIVAGDFLELARDLGVASTLRKPFSMLALRAAVTEALGMTITLSRPSASMATILVIDDDNQHRAAVRKILEASGYKVLEAKNPEMGEPLYRKERPELVVVDFFMPEKSGLTLIRDLRREFADARFIAMSGESGLTPADYHHLAFAVGAAATLFKPFTAEELLETISQVLKAKND